MKQYRIYLYYKNAVIYASDYHFGTRKEAEAFACGIEKGYRLSGKDVTKYEVVNIRK